MSPSKLKIRSYHRNRARFLDDCRLWRQIMINKNCDTIWQLKKSQLNLFNLRRMKGY